jgi:cell division protein FtsB
MFDRRLARAAGLLVVISAIALLAACSAAAPAALPGEPDAAAEPAADGGRQDGSRAGGETGGPVADAETGLRDGALIVYTGQLRLEVPEIGPAIESATRLIVDLSGYVSGSEEENTSSSHEAAVTFRVPAARWAEAVSGVRALAARVISENTEAVEVTAEVVDLEARIANLRAGEAALQEIMTRAGTIDDVLKVQRELSSVRGEIEQLSARRDHLQRQAAHGTLVVAFETPVVAATAAQEGWQLGTEVDRAFADLIRIGQGLTSLAVWLAIVALPVVLPVAVLLFIAYRLRRRFVPGNTPSDPLTPSV